MRCCFPQPGKYWMLQGLSIITDNATQAPEHTANTVRASTKLFDSTRSAATQENSIQCQFSGLSKPVLNIVSLSHSLWSISEPSLCNITWVCQTPPPVPIICPFASLENLIEKPFENWLQPLLVISKGWSQSSKEISLPCFHIMVRWRREHWGLFT